MKRKASRVGKLRLSPNEETMLLKEEYERRRKLRLQQVREQQKYISSQIRQKVKQRRAEKLHQLEETLRAEWQKAQEEKMKALEKLFLSSLRAVGEGHRQAKENEPDLEALAKQAEERKQKAEKRHKKALKEHKLQKERLLCEQTRRIDARKHALDVERERAARVASLPPPLPHPLENLEVKKIAAMKAHGAGRFSATRYHISEPYVDRERNAEQPDARLAAEEEVKRLKELHEETERERREQLEKAHLRGSHALKKVHLAQDRERLLKELEQMQRMDQMRRRQMVAQMPPQLFVPGYKRVEMKEDWQRELEFAFEDMYNEDRKMKGDLILQFEPQPLPSPSDKSQDNDLDLSLEQESVCDGQQESGQMVKEEVPGESESHKEVKTHQPQSKLALKKLLNKIRNQKEQWMSKSEKEFPSKNETIESDTIAGKERHLVDLEPNDERHKTSICEAKEPKETLEHHVALENSVVIHPEEQAAKIRMENERQQWLEQIEQQKQEQLALLKQIEEEKARLEIQMQICLEEAKNKKEEEEKSQAVQSCSVSSTDEQKAEHESGSTAVPETRSSGEDSHSQVIRNYQQRLLEQNRLHKQTINEARTRLREYQNKLKQRYLTDPVKMLSSVETTSANLKLVSEQLQQKQGMQSAQSQSPEQVCAEDCTLSLPLPYNVCDVPEKASSQKHREKMHSVYPGRHLHSPEPLNLKFGDNCLSRSCSSQELVGILDTSNKEVREPPVLQLPSVLVTQDVSPPRTHLGARVQQVRFALPAEHSSGPSETEHLKKSDLRWCNHQMETQAEEEPPPVTPLRAATKGYSTVQEATVNSLACHQGSAVSPTRASLEHSCLSEPVSLSHEESVEESLVSKASSFNYSHILNLRDSVLASSESIQAQQQYLKELQEQLDARREALLLRQKIQEQLLMQKQDKLKEQMQKQQEALKEFLNKQVRHSNMNGAMTEPQRPDWISKSDFFQDSENYHLENCDTSQFHRDEMISQDISLAGQIGQLEKALHREQKLKISRPPVTKVKLGLGLEQHELSVIPEVDTPRSCNISFAGKTDSVGGEPSPISTAGESAYRKCCGDALHEEGMSPGSITSYGQQISVESLKQSKQPGLLQELLLMSTENSYDSAQSQDSLVAQDVPVLAAAAGGDTLHSGSSFRGIHAEVLSKVVSMDVGSEASMQAVPCDLSSTISTGSFLTTETLDVSPVDTGLSSDSMEDQVLKRITSSPWDSSLPFTVQEWQETLFEAPESELPEGAPCLDKGSQIHQVLERCCGELNSSSETNMCFEALSAELDFPETERPSPNFCHQLFQPLEPSPAFGVTSPISHYKIQQGNKELRKISAFSAEIQDQSTFVEVRTSNLDTQRSSLMGSQTSKPNNITSEECFKESITLGLEESFHSLQLEPALSNRCQNAARPASTNVVSEESLELNPGIEIGCNENDVSSDRQYEELARSLDHTGLQHSVEDMRHDSLNSLHEQNSFYQLSTTPVTVDEPFPKHTPKEGLAFKKEILSSEKLPAKVLDRKYVKLPEKLLDVHEANKAVEVDSHCKTNAEEPDEGFAQVQKSSRITEGISVEAPDVYLQAAVKHDSFCLGRREKHSNSVAGSSSRIPIWETESGLGIMEEPELTLVSSNDISIAESDAEHMNQERSNEDQTNNPVCTDRSAVSVLTKKREFLPLVPDTDCSVLVRPDGSSTANSPTEGRCPSHQTAEMLLESASAPGSLQEAFVKRKKDFIQKSLRRVEEMKLRERKNEKPEGSRVQRRKCETLSSQKECLLLTGKKGAVVNQLKKVGEVKVSSPEDRKAGEAEMYQRTSRLYNQLSEVKTRKEEKTRQETYAKNRERAKEFQKKMLEKLRAKKPGKTARLGEASKQEALLC
ncbi:centrosomal protein of 295 kDa isoform X1 [Coturnix japonica]|uniref:Centrosomal protein 295 n=1 Tax=Coturnix japonica TaxID=93934 RepID=A0A8C2SWD1_COTJA|nr:centrosomal protein of 295 kDa isoform X1 [Coturnix japonica]XP_032298091.1 centrosomal protein of 295 kDa isoform X1 [Coturnix japonica]